MERDYLARVEAVLAGHPDAAGIVESLREHIEEAATELSDDEISLVQMAQILERLGSPETVRPPRNAPPTIEPESSVDAAPEPVVIPESDRPAAPRSDFDVVARFLDRLWIAYFIGILGLFVPIIDLHFCELISLAMLALAFGAWGRARPVSYRGVGALAWSCFALYFALFPLGLIHLATPLISFVALPVSIGAFALCLMLYWKVMTGTAELLRDAGASFLSEWILRIRQTYLFINAAIFLASILISVAIVFAFGNNRKDILRVELFTLFLLPIGWALGYFYVLRPIGRARDALRATAIQAPYIASFSVNSGFP